MDHYFDLKINPDSEMSKAELTAKIYTKFHTALCTMQTNQIGISFPKAQLDLGNIFRIHSNESQLKELQNLNWLGGLIGYCEISQIQPVPVDSKYRVVSAKRSNMGQAKLRRLINRGNIDEEGIKRYKRKMLSQWFDNPYIDLVSRSTGQIYRKFFQFGPIQAIAIEGTFDSFGLSKTATVPYF